MKFREARLESMNTSIQGTQPENEKVFELQEKLSQAEETLDLADIEVEVVRAKIETFKMLVNLEGN